MANRRIQRGKELSDYLRAMNEDVTKLNNRNYVTSIAANAIGSDQIGSDVVLDNKTISSSNYLPGISGWMIDGFGNSEFANVLVRGDINAYSGTIGYWNISQPLVSRTFGDYVLRGTLLESSNLGLTDDGVDIGTYVGLFKSYVDTEVSITSISRTSETATAIVLSHNYSVGDYVKVSIDEDSSFDTDSAIVVDISNTSFKYHSVGDDVILSEVTGSSILDIRDIAGLYLRDYSKSEFDYGYFSNTGVAYVSAEDVNLIENPSFEYIDSGLTPVSSNVSWTAAAGSTFSLEEFNDGTDPQFQYDSSYGGKVLWSSALSTYFAGRIDYLIGTSYNIFKSGRVLYLGMTMFPSYVATRSVPASVDRYNSSGSLYWRIDTYGSHGLSGGDTVLLDFDGVQFDALLGEYVGNISEQNVTGGYTRTRTVLSSPAPTSTRFYIDSGYSFIATLADGVTLLNVDEIRAPNTTVAALGSDAYGTRPAYVYKVVNAAFNLSEIRFRFDNGSTVNISDVASIETVSNWDTESKKYLISDPTLYALGYNDASIGIPPMYKSVQTIVDANALQASYKLLDPTSYAAGTDIYIDIPAWTYSHDGAGYVSASPTKIASGNYILDNIYLSTTTKSFFGGSLPNVRWASSTVEDPSYDPAQASIEGTKQWINIDLDTQTAYLDYFNYVGFKQSNFSRSMLVSPNITTSDSISAKIVIPTDHETLTVTSGTYRYINNGGDYIDLVSSLKTVTGDRDTGFELVASKKYHSGVTETILAEETALIAGYWDESASKSIIKIKAEIFTLSGQSTDYITATSSGTTIHGDLTVNGTTTTVNSTTVTVDDKNIELASTASPSDVLADGAGITVKGTGNKTWTWVDATNSWTSNQDIDIISTGTDYRIGGTSVLNATTLGGAVINSSLTKVAPLSGGTAGFVKVDASGNLTSTSASASMATLIGFTTTVTSGTAVVLTNASTYYQQFTGSTAQTITLPVTSTLATGWTFHIVNNSTANLTVNSSGGNLVITVIPGTTAMVTCIATAGTGAANWEAGLTDFSTYTGTGDVVLSASPTFSGTVTVNTPGTVGTNALRLRSTTDGAGNLSNLRFESSNGNLFDIGKNEVTSQGGAFYLYTGSALPIELYNSATKRLIIESTGNINIGPTTGAGTAKLSVFSAAAGTVTQFIRGATSQTADLLQVQDISANILGGFSATGRLLTGGSAATAVGSLLLGATNTVAQQLGVVARETTTVGVVVRGAASATANLQEWQNSAGTVLASVNPSGDIQTSAAILAGTSTWLSATSTIRPLNSGIIGQVIRGVSGQSVDLLAIQNNSATVDGRTTVSGFDSAANLFVNNTTYGFSTIIANPANTTFWKIATLPISNASTYDHIIVDAVLDDNWGSDQKAHARVIFSNRNAFTYRYYLNGTVRTTSRILAYTEADGSISVYMRLQASSYSSFSYNITHGIAGVTVYKNPAATTTAPTGTLAFDSGTIATYVPQMYVPYTGAPQIQGNSLAYLTNTGGITASTFTSTVAIGTAPLTVTSTTKVANLNADLLDGFDSSQTATANTVAVRNTDGALAATSLVTSGYRTTGTGLSFVNQWTKIATISHLSQFSNVVSLIDFASDGPGNTDIAHGRLFVSTKQQQAMGSPPEQPTIILYNGFNATINDFALILTQNDGTATRFDLYFRNTNFFQTVGFIPIFTNGTGIAFFSSQPYITNLPQAFSNNATNSVETKITPIDNMSNYFNGVTNRFQVTYQGVATNVKNPFRLMISVNGVVQTVNTPEYTWQSPIPYDGFFLDTDGFVNFSDIPIPGSTFDGRILAGSTTSTETKNYPFRAVDLLIGA